MSKHTYPVEGMTCAACVARVEKAVGKFDELKNVSVNFATEELSFETEESNPDIDKISKAVEDSGYKLNALTDSGKTTSRDSVNKISESENKDSHYNKLKNDFVFALTLTIPIFIISMLYDFEFFREIWQINRQNTNNILLVLTTPIIFISGNRFFQIFWKNLKHFNAEMNSLVAIGTGAAYGYSVFATLFPSLIEKGGVTPHVYFETAVVIITLILMGRLLEARAKRKTSSAIKELLALRPKKAFVKVGETVKEVSVDSLEIDDVVVVKPGSKIPADGIIVKGESGLDESVVTGESLPVEKKTGDKVVGGSFNISGYIEFRVTATGENSFLGHIVQLVREAQGAKVPIQRLADKIASIFTPVVIIIALATFTGWILYNGEITVALINFVAVLIVACPCALGLATPTAIMVGTGLGAKNGIIIRDGVSLEVAKNIKFLIFDKTGTLTIGKPQVTSIEYLNEKKISYLEMAAAVENGSEHPLANAIINAVENFRPQNYEVEKFETFSGFGLTAEVDNNKIAIGNKKLAKKLGYDFTPAEDVFKRFSLEGKTPVAIYINGIAEIVLGIEDPVKEEAYDVISELNKKNITTIIVSGDNIRTVKAIAKKLNIEKAHGEILPAGKSDIVNKYKESGEITAMVGDGINDAPALAAADIGISLGSGTDAAIESSKVTILQDNLRAIISLLNLSEKSISAIKQNLFWAFIYNITGIPLAAFGMLNPMIAAFAMSLSSVSVVSNSLRLRSKKL